MYMCISRKVSRRTGRSSRRSRSEGNKMDWITPWVLTITLGGLTDTKNAPEIIYIDIFEFLEVVLLKDTCSQIRCVAARKSYRTRGYIIVSPRRLYPRNTLSPNEIEIFQDDCLPTRDRSSVWYIPMHAPWAPPPPQCPPCRSLYKPLNETPHDV